MEFATSVATWRYGCLEARCRCSDVEAWRLELWRRAEGLRDVEVFASRDMELWRRAAGVGTCRTCRTHRGMELWSSGGTLQA